MWNLKKLKPVKKQKKEKEKRKKKSKLLVTMGLGSYIRVMVFGNFPAVQWLGLCASTEGGTGSIPGQGTMIPQAAQCGQEKKKSDSV